jgi:hypothetical protein
MTSMPFKEPRKVREEVTKLAISEILKTWISDHKIRQMTILRDGDISRSHLRSVLRAEKQASVFFFLELCVALSVEDPGQLLREVAHRREQLLADHAKADGAQ